jgi:thiosulfate reductase cytochrome b subunit
MADSISISGLAIPRPDPAAYVPRHSALVRVTHWISALGFIGLLVSGIGILLSHPRFYWGETGGLGTASIFDLPLPFMLGGPSGWGRYLHFESAWLCVINRCVYVVASFARRHFQTNFVRDYSAVQRLSYLAVIFFLLPLLIWTGLAMSPAVTSVFPVLVNVLGGHQCARTIHFFAAVCLVLFFLVHIVMVSRAGFRTHVVAMITGRPSSEESA